MKIGIISEFNNNTVNYGNHLQAYALNYILRQKYHADCVHSIILRAPQLKKFTNVFSFKFVVMAIRAVLRKMGIESTRAFAINRELVRERLQKFEDFRQEHFRDGTPVMNGNDLLDTDYDALIAGSDVVWMQYSQKINRTKFLDFSSKAPFKRIAYAASFGEDSIPRENVRYLRKCLKNFDAISVREHSTVSLLNGIGIPEVSYCLDPTLLLTAGEWEAVEEKPSAVSPDEKYVFVYLLGRDVQQRKDIIDIAEKAGLRIVHIPYTMGARSAADDIMNGTALNGCSIGNWIWLIHHAQYVITDSFHGAVFSTIFHKRFVVLKRYTISGSDINNRMQDYLREIDQLDKFIPSDQLQHLEAFEWDYQEISENLDVRRKNSMAFLDQAIGEVNA